MSSYKYKGALGMAKAILAEATPNNPTPFDKEAFLMSDDSLPSRIDNPTPDLELETVAYRWQLDTWPDDHWGLSELSQLECHSGAFGQPIQEELVRRSEAAATISRLTAERDTAWEDRQQSARAWRDSFEGMHQRAITAEKRVKELVETLQVANQNTVNMAGRCDYWENAQTKSIQIIGQMGEANKLLSDALEPFAKAADQRQVMCDDTERVTWSAITVGDLRRARRARSLEGK